MYFDDIHCVYFVFSGQRWGVLHLIEFLSLCLLDTCIVFSLCQLNTYRLFNVLCWLWNIYEGAELPSVYFINNTKHCITYLALTQLFPVLISHPEMYTLCSILQLFV